MQIVPFVAHTAAEAFNRIQAQMGPDAVVINVRQLPVSGLARLWRKPRIEVLACPPETTQPHSPVLQPKPQPAPPPSPAPAPLAPQEEGPLQSTWGSPSLNSRWKVSGLLHTAGLTQMAAQTVLEDLESRWGKEPPSVLGDEISKLRETLRNHWVVQGPLDSRKPQVLVGAPGCGKTTLLCKWLTRLVLSEGRPCRVFRADGTSANQSEMLEVHADVLGIPLERSLQSITPNTSEEWRLVDIPGVDWRDPRALGELRRVLDKITGAQVHLVLNGAYEIPVLLSQVRAFSALSLGGVMVTHLDEESRWGKLWNLMFGIPLELRFLSVGSAIPAGLLPASPERITDRWLGSDASKPVKTPPLHGLGRSPA